MASFNVVLADDSPRARMFVGTALRNAKHTVVGAAETGAQAVMFCRKTKPDLVMLDISMPVMNGLEAAKIIHDEGLARHIVIVSSNIHAGFVEQGRAAGAIVIGKTNDAKHLIAMLAENIPEMADGS